jgi:AbrB family looped-hinge helix DNA binding protein
MKVADEVWTSVALLHKENPERADFSVEEIKARAKRENWLIRPGFYVHASYHCLANKPANPANHRLLYENSRGRKRLYRLGDPVHPERQSGRTRPEKTDLLPAYRSLVDWYDQNYSKQDPVPSGSLEGTPANVTVPHRFPPERNAANWPFAGVEEMQSGTVFVGAEGTIVLPERLRQELGIKEGSCLSVYRENDRLVVQPITEEFISSLVGCCKGDYSLLEDREREHRKEK